MKERIKTLLEKAIDTNIRKGDKIIINTERRWAEIYNNKEVTFNSLWVGELHFNHYGESKRNKSTGGSVKKIFIEVIFEDDRGRKFLQEFSENELVDFEPVVGKHPRRKKSPYNKYKEVKLK